MPVPNDVIPVPPLATGRVPVTPVVSGSPVTFVITPDAGVPRAGVVNVGDVKVLLVRVCVVEISTVVPVSMLNVVPDNANPVPAV